MLQAIRNSNFGVYFLFSSRFCVAGPVVAFSLTTLFYFLCSSSSSAASRDQLEERERTHFKDTKRARGEDVSGLLEDGPLL